MCKVFGSVLLEGEVDVLEKIGLLLKTESVRLLYSVIQEKLAIFIKFIAFSVKNTV